MKTQKEDLIPYFEVYKEGRTDGWVTILGIDWGKRIDEGAGITMLEMKRLKYLYFGYEVRDINPK